MPSLVVALVNYNGFDETSRALKSIDLRLSTGYEVIVVDNGSTDESVVKIREKYPQVTVLQLFRNAGYPGGCNAAIEYSSKRGAEFVLLCNNDVVFAPDTIARLLRTAEIDSKISIVVPRIYYSGDHLRIWAAGAEVSRLTGLTRQRGMGLLEHEFKPSPNPVDLETCTGCCMLVRISTIAMAGKLREEFFLYYDEVDWCWRMKKKGLRIVLDDGSHLWHQVSRSVGLSSPMFWYYLTRNQILFVRLNFPMKYRLTAVSFLIGGVVPIRILQLALNKTQPQIVALFHGLIDGLFGRTGPRSELERFPKGR